LEVSGRFSVFPYPRAPTEEIPMTRDVAYVLGSSSPEIARLDLQAAAMESVKDLLLRRAAIEAGQRVLDLGTGPEHVPFALWNIVGPAGRW
jgi:hypothetical protein